MPAPFRGVINVDVTQSVPDWGPYTQPIAPEGTPSVLYIVLDDVGYSATGSLRRADRDAEHRPHRRAGPDLHQLPHDGAVLADPILPDDRAEPHHQRHGHHHRGRVGLPQLERAYPVRVRHDRRGTGRARLEHLHDRQVAPDRRGRDEHGLAEGAVAGRAGLRAVLRLPRRRDQPVVPGPGLRQPPRRAAGVAVAGLPPHRRPDRQGAGVHPRRQGGRPGQAVLPLLLPGRVPRPAPRPEGVDRQVPGQVRHGLRGLPGAGVRAAEAAWGSSPTRPSCRRSTPTRRDERRREGVARAGHRAALGFPH